MIYAVGLIVIVIVIVMIAISVWANSRLREYDRLPMQWSLSGKVNWTAPRVIGLSFFPMLAVIMVLTLSLLSQRLPYRPGHDAYAIPLVAALLLAIQCAHLLMAMRTLR
jgi:hypothetical protein